jgi:hypothetical protein
MALAPYYDKASIAASQVVAGFDPAAFEAELTGTAVGVSFSSADIARSQGAACVDLTLRLLARLYPTLAIVGEDDCADKVDALKGLATSINPRIEFADQAPIGIAIGSGVPWASTVFAGSTAWTGTISTGAAQSVGEEDIPFGAGIAACLAVGAIFRLLFLADTCAGTATLSAFEPGTEPAQSGAPFRLDGRSALVGTGAIGQAVVWTLARSRLQGEVHFVDGETFDLSNLQRYVLTTMDDIDRRKATFASQYLKDFTAVRGIPIDEHWPDAVTGHGSTWDRAIVAVDSAAARREVQSTLPHHIINAWTQTGDLGVSEHDFLTGACLACLYLPTGTSTNEDEIVANALGVPEYVLQIRDLLYRNLPAPPALLDLVAERLGIDDATIGVFEERSVRDLYVEGICGGTLVPVGTGAARIHVPLAHQSALAGVLLAARLYRQASGYLPATTEVSRIDVRRDVPEHPHQHANKDPRGICICQDTDYLNVYRELWC